MRRSRIYFSPFIQKNMLTIALKRSKVNSCSLHVELFKSPDKVVHTQKNKSPYFISFHPPTSGASAPSLLAGASTISAIHSAHFRHTSMYFTWMLFTCLQALKARIAPVSSNCFFLTFCPRCAVPVPRRSWCRWGKYFSVVAAARQIVMT